MGGITVTFLVPIGGHQVPHAVGAEDAGDLGQCDVGIGQMLQDIEGGRPTELDVFGGKVVALGHKLDIPTPANEALLHIIRVLETRGS